MKTTKMKMTIRADRRKKIENLLLKDSKEQLYSLCCLFLSPGVFRLSVGREQKRYLELQKVKKI